MKTCITQDMINRATYISWDPGETTGVALWDDKGNTIIVTDLNLEDLNKILDLIEYFPPKEFIIEEYRVRPDIPHGGSKVPTIQTIGRIKRVAEKKLIQVIELRPSVKSQAAKWAQVKIPKGHMPDWLSAYLIGYYHLHYNKKIIPAKVLDS